MRSPSMPLAGLCVSFLASPSRESPFEPTTSKDHTPQLLELSSFVVIPSMALVMYAIS